MSSIIVAAIELAPEGIDIGGIILAVIGLVGGGAILKLYQQYSLNKKDKRDDENEPEVAFRRNLIDRQDEMREDILFLRERVEELIAENATIKAENVTLIRQNKELIKQNAELLIRLDTLKDKG